MINKDYKRNFYLLLIISFFACLALGYYSYNKHSQVVMKDTEISILTDTIRLYKTKSGASGAEKRIIVGTKSEILKVLKFTKPNSIAYQTINNTKSLISYSEVTSKVNIDTTVKVKLGPVNNDLKDTEKLILSREIDEPKGYYNASVQIKNDSLSLKVQMKDKYHITTSKKSNGFFKPKSDVINITNENKYITIDSLSSFEIKPKNKVKKGIKLGGLVAIAIGTFLLLHK